MAKKMNKTSKRIPAARRYRIEKKVREHNKKLKRQKKKNGNKRHPKKNITVPNSAPFKDQVLREAEERKRKMEELRQKQKEERSKLLMRARGLEGLKKSAEKRTKAFENKEADVKELSSKCLGDGSTKAFYKEFRKVVEVADVVLEVLDARDPLSSRCPQVEKAVLDAGTNKRLVLVLNKIDLIPKENLVKWLKYLRNEFPTVAFKASTQNQRENLKRNKVSVLTSNENLTQSSQCLGSNILMKLLGNYCRHENITTSIRVGVVGFPNVGKSSIINSLKRSRVCSVGATPGVTRSLQEIQLDKHIMLLDSPGIVLAKGSDMMAVLKNTVKVETVSDPIAPVEAILKRCNREQLILSYRVTQFDTVQEFLFLLAKRMGKMKKGGFPDAEAAARRVLTDWNTGKIKYYTHPPETHELPCYISAEIVTEMSKAFVLEEAVADEMSSFKALPNVSEHNSIQVTSGGFTEGILINEDIVDGQLIAEESMQDVVDDQLIAEENIQNSDSNPTTGINMLGENILVNVISKTLKKSTVEIPKNKKVVAKILAKATALPENQQLNKWMKLQQKKLKKKNRKSERLATTLSDTLSEALNFLAPRQDGDNYDFSVDYK